MTVIAFSADQHIANHQQHGGPIVSGINTRGKMALDALAASADVVGPHDAYVLLGDLFHHVRPEPQLVAAVQRELSRMTRPIVLLGNHDLAGDGPRNHALAPLEPVADVVDTPQVIRVHDVDLVCIPFRPGPASTWLQGDLDVVESQRSAPHTVLCIHLGLSDAKTPYYLDGAEDSISVAKLERWIEPRGYEFVFAGNWHKRRSWLRKTVHFYQVGTLAPNRSSDDGFTHVGSASVLEINGKQAVVRHVDVPGPRFIRPHSLAEIIVAAQQASSTTIVHATVTRDHYDEAVQHLKRSNAYAYSVEVDAGLAKAEAREAAQAAKRADTLGEAIAAYVESMPLPDGLCRATVLARTRKYLNC